MVYCVTCSWSIAQTTGGLLKTADPCGRRLSLPSGLLPRAKPFLPRQASAAAHGPLCEKPQACPPSLTKSCQIAINILIPPSAPTANRPDSLFFPPQRRLLGCSDPARGFLGFISQCPGGQLWFSRGHGAGGCGQEGPPLLPSIKYSSPDLRAPVATGLAV